MCVNGTSVLQKLRHWNTTNYTNPKVIDCYNQNLFRKQIIYKEKGKKKTTNVNVYVHSLSCTLLHEITVRNVPHNMQVRLNIY